MNNNDAVEIIGMGNPEQDTTHASYMLWVAFGLIIVMAVLLGYWRFYPYKFYTINNNMNEAGQPCEPDRSHDKEMGSFYRGCGIKIAFQGPLPDLAKELNIPFLDEPHLIYQANVCFHTDARGGTTILYIDKKTGLQEGKIDRPLTPGEGCIDVVSFLPLPEDLEPGQYYIRFISTVRPNPIRALHKETQTLVFTIPPR